jgi:hypothetical protein
MTSEFPLSWYRVTTYIFQGSGWSLQPNWIRSSVCLRQPVSITLVCLHVSRGTGRTIPFACDIDWTKSPTVTKLRPRNGLLQQDLLNVLESKGWEDSKYVAERCYEVQNKTGSLLSTAFVVRDMIRIIDALGEDGMLRYWGMIKSLSPQSSTELTYARHVIRDTSWSNLRSNVP